MSAAVSEPARCWRCHFLISDPAELTTKLHRSTGKRADFHVDCFEAMRSEQQASRAAAVAHAEARLEGRMANVPRWPRAGTPEFLRRVESRKLRGTAERWTPARGNLALRGPSGVGKTSCMAAIAWGLYDQAIKSVLQTASHHTDAFELVLRSFWTSGPELAAARRQHPLGQGEAPAIERARGASLLFLDELGQEQGDPRWLLELLDHRYRLGRRTISSTGLTAVELDGHYGVGTCRRLVEPVGDAIDLHAGGAGGG